MIQTYKNIFWTLVMGALYVPQLLFAQISNPLQKNTISEFIVAALEILRNIGFMICIFFILYAGFMLVTARGEEAKITTGKNALLWSLVGKAVLLGATVFAEALKETVEGL